MLRRGPVPEKIANEKENKDHVEVAPVRSTEDFILGTGNYDVKTIEYVKKLRKNTLFF